MSERDAMTRFTMRREAIIVRRGTIGCRTLARGVQTMMGRRRPPVARPRFLVYLLVCLLAYSLVGARNTNHAPAAAGDDEPRCRVLVFSKTAGFRHESIPAGLEALYKLGEQRRFDVQHTEDASMFADVQLDSYDVVVFLNTTGDVLDAEQERAFQRFIQAGGGYVGIHAATDTEYEWSWYGELVGAWFAGHPASQDAVIQVVDRKHPSTRHLPAEWKRHDEWYNFRAKLDAKKYHILARLDESSYRGGTMEGDHPIAWCHEFDGGRAWYTAGGHTEESYSEREFLKHLAGGILWAAGVEDPEVDDDG